MTKEKIETHILMKERILNNNQERVNNQKRVKKAI